MYFIFCTFDNESESNASTVCSVNSIHGFTSESDRLEFITPNTRYVIPHHIEELMTNLYR